MGHKIGYTLLLLAMASLLLCALPASAATQTLTIISDASTQRYDPGTGQWVPAIECWVHPSWANIEDARWIWVAYEAGSPYYGTVYTFKKGFTIPTDATNIHGTVEANADDSYQLKVNGANIGSSTSWGDVESYDISSALAPGSNEINIGGYDSGGSGGLIFKATITYDTGVVQENYDSAVIVSDTIPDEVTAGQSYEVSVTMRNLGDQNWTQGVEGCNNVRLHVMGDLGNAYLSMPEGTTINPGGDATFTYTITAPLDGAWQTNKRLYSLAYRMDRENSGDFGNVLNHQVVSVDPRIYDAVFVSDTVPDEMIGGQSYDVSVVVRNTGNQPWAYDVPGVINVRFWVNGDLGQENFRLPSGTIINPGEELTFNYTINAGLYNNTCTITYQMYLEGSGGFGATLNHPVVDLCIYNATVVEETVPAEMLKGQSANVSITMRNVGNQPWTRDAPGRSNVVFYIMSDLGWQTIYLPSGTVVNPGEEYTFNYTLTVPLDYRWGIGNSTYNQGYQLNWEGSSWFGEYLSHPLLAIDNRTYNATIVSETIPDTMLAGETRNFSITVLNTGNQPWTQNDPARNNVMLYCIGDFGWFPINMPDGTVVNPGEEYTFSYTFTAPLDNASNIFNRSYNLAYRMNWDGHELFGETLNHPLLSVDTRIYDAMVVSETVPAEMIAGQSYNVSITMRNTGNEPWTQDISGRYNVRFDVWGDLGGYNFYMPSGTVINPGEEYTFNYTIVAPLDYRWNIENHSYAPYYQMVWEYHGNFGQCLNHPVLSVDTRTYNASIVGDTIPDQMIAGETYNFTLTVRNTGNQPWTQDDPYRNNVRLDVWGDLGGYNLYLPSGWVVNPGEEYTFNYTIVAPLDYRWNIENRSYSPYYRMDWEWHGYIGQELNHPVLSVDTRTYNASIVGDTIPDELVAGQTYNFSITVRNTGNQPWTQDDPYRNNVRFGVWGDLGGYELYMPSGWVVNPGEEYTFYYTITPPLDYTWNIENRTYNPYYQMAWDWHGYIGEQLSHPVLSVDTRVYNATVVSDTIPAEMIAGQTYDVSVTMKNTGNQPWTQDVGGRQNVRFEMGGEMVWTSAYMPSGTTVNPGDECTFTFQMTAPYENRTFNPGFHMVWDGHGNFGGEYYHPVVDLMLFNATIVRDTIPNEMVAGQTYDVSVTVMNTGNQPWSEDAGPNYYVRLARTGEFGSDRASIPSGVVVNPGEEYTFNFQMTAPYENRSFNVSYQMYSDWWYGHYYGAFGETFSKPVSDLMLFNATIVSDTIPASMLAGQSYDVSMTVRNTGNQPWSEDAGPNYYVRLARTGEFGPDRVYLPSGTVVNPGDDYTFSFTMTAPMENRTFNVGYQMYSEWWYGHYYGAFGEASSEPVASMMVFNATVVGDTIPDVMVGGQSYDVTVTVKNTGNQPWSEDTSPNYCVRLVRSGEIGLERIYLPPGVVVNPGEEHTFSFTITAPHENRTFNVGYQMWSEWWGGYYYGSFGEAWSHPVADLTIMNATVVSDTIPDEMVAGQSYDVSVTVRNTGNQPWSEDVGPYYNDRLARTGELGPDRVYLPSGTVINPNCEYTFNFTIVAPYDNRTYNVGYQMYSEWWGGYYYGYFGEAWSHPVTDLMIYNAEVVNDTIPDTMAAGRTYTVSVAMRNTGNQPWTESTWPYNYIRLGGAGDAGSFGFSRVYLPSETVVYPGGVYNFTFTLTAPGTGSVGDITNYTPQFQMVKDDTGAWFGSLLSHPISTAVVDNTPPVTAATYSGTQGQNGWFTSNVQVTLSATDDSSGVARTEYTLDGGIIRQYAQGDVIYVNGNGHHTLTYRSVDSMDNAEGWNTVTVNVDATAPVVKINSPAPITTGTSSTFKANLTEQFVQYARWDWGDSSYSYGTINGVASGSHVYKTPGFYTITLSVYDQAGNVGTSQCSLTVYNPNNTILGSGWFVNPAGAAQIAPGSSIGNVTFNAKYVKGSSIPTGFMSFKLGKLSFSSTSLDWLMVKNGVAQLSGNGTYNGKSGYKFLLTAAPNTYGYYYGAGKIRVKIWEVSTGNVVYDNQRGAADTVAPGTILTGTLSIK